MENMYSLVEGLPYVVENGKPYIYVMDNGKPYKASVVERREGEMLIHFYRWKKTYDTYISINSDRIVDVSKTADGGIPISELGPYGEGEDASQSNASQFEEATATEHVCDADETIESL